MCEGCFRGGGSFQGNRLLPPHWLYPSSVMNLGKVYGLKTGSERRRLFTKTCVSYQSLLISLGVSPGIVAGEKRQRVTGSFAAGCGWIIPAILSRLKLHFFQRIGSILHLFCQILHSNHLCGKKGGVSSHQLQAAETGIWDLIIVGEFGLSFVLKLVLALYCKASFKYIRKNSAKTRCPLQWG